MTYTRLLSCYAHRMYTNTVGHLSSTEVTRITGITYRQLDYWVRNGVIPPDWVDDPSAGSGRARRWHPEAIPALQVAGRISRALPRGTNLSSGDMKRVLANWNRGYITFDDGIALSWTP